VRTPNWLSPYEVMPDVVDPQTRSRMMSGIRGTNTKPELRVRQLLHRRGFRFRLHVKSLPGKPDIVLRQFRAVVLVHGCFWHGHNCALFKWPSTRPDWWRSKIEGNRLQDQKTLSALHSLGWRVCEVWECAFKGKARLNESQAIDELASWLRSDSKSDLTIRGTS
jgi:DNA mismatch endonuclease (patch repair protein)